MYLPGPRRIVTKHNDRDLATVASDAVIELKDDESFEGLRSGAIWATADLLPTRDNSKVEDGASCRPDFSSSFGLVHPNGTNFIYTDFAPGYTSHMHRTLSLDYDILVSGQIVHITEDGIEKHLAVGDVAVQKEPCMRGKIRPHHRGPG